MNQRPDDRFREITTVSELEMSGITFSENVGSSIRICLKFNLEDRLPKGKIRLDNKIYGVQRKGYGRYNRGFLACIGMNCVTCPYTEVENEK